MDYSQVILSPITTEKSLDQQERGVWSFWVHPRASKPMIKRALEKAFSVNPVKVKTINLKPKKKNLWRKKRTVALKARKKALVWLAEGEKIEAVKSKKKK